MYDSKMRSGDYPEGYWERAEGSNYRNYGDDEGWNPLVLTMNHFLRLDGIEHPAIREVACAKGWFVWHCFNFGWTDTQGCDISEYAISHAAPGMQWVITQANATDLPWADSSADVVCSWEFFEHVPEDEVQRVLDEKIRVVRPGGDLWMKICLPDLHNADTDATHVTMQPRGWWEDLFRRNNLERRPEVEAHLDGVFRDRDWAGRFFVWRRKF